MAKAAKKRNQRAHKASIEKVNKRAAKKGSAPEMEAAAQRPNNAARAAAIVTAHAKLRKIDEQRARLAEQASAIKSELKDEYGVSKQGFAMAYRIAKMEEGAARQTLLSDFQEVGSALDLFTSSEVGRMAEAMAGKPKKRKEKADEGEGEGEDQALPLSGGGAKEPADTDERPPEQRPGFIEKQGKEAAAKGMDADTNPYPDGSDAHAKWVKGYTAAKGEPATRH